MAAKISFQSNLEFTGNTSNPHLWKRSILAQEWQIFSQYISDSSASQYCKLRENLNRDKVSSALYSRWDKVSSALYSRFQITFHCNIPNFVAKLGSSLWSSKVHFRIHKPVCKQRLWLAPELNEVNQMLSLQTGLRILKWTFELRNEFPNFATKFGILQWNAYLKSTVTRHIP